jgi:molybdopterin-binding protein
MICAMGCSFAESWYDDNGKGNAMKISARNVLKGKVKRIIRGAVNSEVVIEIGGGMEITSIITNASVDHLELKEGSKAFAVIKASSVMIAVD